MLAKNKFMDLRLGTSDLIHPPHFVDEETITRRDRDLAKAPQRQILTPDLLSSSSDISLSL